MATVVGGCGAEMANRWAPESAIHAAVYRRSERGVRLELANRPETINLIAWHNGWWGPLSEGYFHVTPLDLARIIEWPEGERLLLEAGAKTDYEINPRLYAPR